MLKLGIAGCTGRMGQTLLEVAAGTKGCAVAIGSERAGPAESLIRERIQHIAPPAMALTFDAAEMFKFADAVIDFTAPDSTVALAKAAADTGKIHIIGTTGFEPHHLAAIQEAAKKARIVQSGNYSLGVNVLELLVEQAAKLLSDVYDIEVDEMHHNLKKDAPSGTALMLAKAAAKGRGVDFSKAKTHYGEGQLGERVRGTIGMSVRRGGEVVGEHTVTLAGPGETLELTHRASSRSIYAHGAIKAAMWAADKPAGLYTMRDVLGL
jgi:4-hydroxy-tetrahydrodipicolinate reductase